MPVRWSGQRPKEKKERREKTTSLYHVQISLLKKSVAPSTAMWLSINSRHVTVFLRSGAGGMPWRLSMLPTV
jgi:hypothetical protein